MFYPASGLPYAAAVTLFGLERSATFPARYIFGRSRLQRAFACVHRRYRGSSRREGRPAAPNSVGDVSRAGGARRLRHQQSIAVRVFRQRGRNPDLGR